MLHAPNTYVPSMPRLARHASRLALLYDAKDVPLHCLKGPIGYY